MSYDNDYDDAKKPRLISMQQQIKRMIANQPFYSISISDLIRFRFQFKDRYPKIYKFG